MNVAGDFSHLEQMVARGASSTKNLSADNIQPINIDIATIGASPNLPIDQTIVAGGFRTGIYISRDFGKTWKLTLEDPSSLVPGNNEIWSIKFLSEKSVIAINGGELTWEVLP